MAINNPFDKTPAQGGKPTAGDTGSADAIVDLFNREDSSDEKKESTKKEVKEDKKENKDDDEEELELKEEDDNDEEKLDLKEKKEEDKEEEDEEEKDEEEDEKEELNAPPRKKEIEKFAPGIFKKFAFLEKMLYRDKEITELFGSFDEAKEVASKVTRLNEFENQLLGGNTEEILKTVKEADPKAYDKIIDDYIGVLERTDKDAFLDVTENISKRIIMGMVAAAKKSDDKELTAAAQELHNYMFGKGTDWTDPKVRVPKEEEGKKNEVEEERKTFMQERFIIARDDLQLRVDNVLKSTISDHIDPKGLMSDYEKRNAVKDALEEIHKLAGNDVAFKKNLNTLWTGAAASKFSPASLDAIKKAYLGKSKSVAMIAIKKIRAEALKGKTNKREEKEEPKEETSRERKPVTAGRPAQTKKANGRQPGESIGDYFGRD